MKSGVITRFPPSPTGFFHVGSARTALFNYLFAKKKGGKFVLRFEDTDKERSKKEYEQDIIDGLSWLGITPDGEPTRQSERTELYTKHLQKLIDDGKAHEAEASEKGSGKVIRFKNPNTTITFNDLVRGEVSFDTTELGDFVIARSNDEPLYHLAVVVDDMDAGVTHVIRGEDHISNTARHILLIEALGGTRPEYAHIPLILAPDRSKLSKRHGAISLNEYKVNGYLPEALLNYLALLGWHPEGEEEVFTLEELEKVFDLNRVQKGGAMFNTEKLNWLNKQHLEKLSDDEYLKQMRGFMPENVPDDVITKLMPQLRERYATFGEVRDAFEDGAFDFMLSAPTYEVGELLWKEQEKSEAQKHLEHVVVALEKLSSFTEQDVKDALWDYAEKEGKGNVLWPMRYALSGLERSPDPFALAELLGREETLERLRTAINILSESTKNQTTNNK